jgi:hypothetical protein
MDFVGCYHSLIRIFDFPPPAPTHDLDLDIRFPVWIFNSRQRINVVAKDDANHN